MEIHCDHLVERSSSDLLTLSHEKRNEIEVLHTQQPQCNINDFPCEEFPFSAQSSHITEKFILDFLTLPEVTRPVEAKAEPIHDGPTSWQQQRPEGISDQFSMTWDPDSLNEALSVAREMDISIDSKQSQIDSSTPCEVNGRAQGDESVKTCSYKNAVNDEDIFKSSGSELRSRRRREFHKIHTRRSRAKLNEKMDLLKRVLPKPPSGVVVKSKAQIIDYAISVLGQLSFSHIQGDGVCPSKA